MPHSGWKKGTELKPKIINEIHEAGNRGAKREDEKVAERHGLLAEGRSRRQIRILQQSEHHRIGKAK